MGHATYNPGLGGGGGYEEMRDELCIQRYIVDMIQILLN